MKPKVNGERRLPRGMGVIGALILLALTVSRVTCLAQQTVGSIAGTVMDVSGGVVQDADIKARNVATNLKVTAHSKSNGSYSISNCPVGTYELTFTKTGFDTETHTKVLVDSDRTTTVDAGLKVGAVSTTVEVSAVALMNQTDATNGYVVDQITLIPNAGTNPRHFRMKLLWVCAGRSRNRLPPQFLRVMSDTSGWEWILVRIFTRSPNPSNNSSSREPRVSIPSSILVQSRFLRNSTDGLLKRTAISSLLQQ